VKHPCKSVTFARSDYEASARDNKGAPISLALDFIYGYASGGRNPVAARGNVFYNVEGKIVYPAGTFGVVYDPRSHTQRFFTDHDAPISYLAMHPNKRYVATAGVASGIPASARVPMRPSSVSQSDSSPEEGVPNEGPQRPSSVSQSDSSPPPMRVSVRPLCVCVVPHLCLGPDPQVLL
jgi:hypothetical protein